MAFNIKNIGEKGLIDFATDILLQNKPICAPTDTIYGVLALDNEEALNYLYKIRRPSKKPFLRLLPDISFLEDYSLVPTDKVYELSKLEGVSIILKAQDKNLGFRIPKKGFIRELLDSLKRPILAPSCNKEGEPPAKSIEEAVNYFKEEIPLYIDGGFIDSAASSIVEIENDKISIVREGMSIEKVKEILSKL
ncbi:L-threonylcarbamoyladenylate synthase [Hydrogenobaculum acidophilum]